jgi:hypothetical protein
MLEPQLTGEQIRFHAAGHLAAAHALAAAGQVEGAKTVLHIIRQFLEAPNVDNPPQFRETIARAIADPVAEMANIASLEAMFCGPENTTLERAGIRMGKG